MKAAVALEKESDPEMSASKKDDIKPTSRGWMVWFIAAFFYLYEYVLRASPSIMTEQLMQDFAMTTTSLGILSSMYYYAYTPLQIPCGLIVDRLGARLVITLSCALCVIGTFMFSYAHDLFLAQAGRFVMGAGSACAFLSTLKLVSDWFPPKYFAVLSGMTTMIGITTGGYLVGKPFALFVNSLSWREAMFWTAIFGVAVTALCWFVIKNTPTETKGESKPASNSSILQDLGVLVRSKQTWLVSLYGCFFYVPVSVFSELWAIPYIMKKYSLDNAEAASISVMLILGKGVGAPGIALLSNYFQSRRKVMFLGSFLATIAFIAAIYLPVPIWMMESLLFITGACAGAQVICFALNQEINPSELSATSVGFTNTVVMLSGIVFQPLLGAFLDFAWDGKLSDGGTRLYGLDAYQTAMIALPICLLISWGFVFFIKETYPHSDARSDKK